ncbi:ABC transporter permease [Acidiferrimicrobium sp. IK]|uniref:ABC transporter permease n=1 Tax=Acidiferrimicrobium sp. IK TaxID=2871700 RepID=UPI0021CB10E3|nr:ABC transporter permease [Acidiferrimicrobium sp. IK]MCU4186725.1 ABC transporter permease [Acidiferrimicrobium sp. IK]
MRYLLRRLGFYVITAWAALTINFFLPRLMPGSPVQAALDKLHGTVSPGVVKALAAQFGINTKASMLSQYGHFWSQMAHGDLGISTSQYPTRVTTIIGHALPWTIALVGVASIISFALGTLLGILIAWRRGSRLEALLPVTTFLSAVPYFWLGLIFVSVFGVTLHWLPISGGYSSDLHVGFSWGFARSALSHGAMPAVTIVLASVAGWMVGMRNMMVTTLGEDYVMVAQAKGLSTRRVAFTYAARNAILPNLAGFALQLGFVVAGSLLTEIVFSYPGIGLSLLQAVQENDYPLMQGVFLVITVVVLLANFVADLLYVALDPRTRQEA